MSTFLSDIFVNILANVIFWVAGGLIVGLVLSAKRRRLHRFFGITRERSLTVYLSNFKVEPNTVKDRFGNIREYQGIVITKNEFLAIPTIATLFSSTAIDRIPDLFAGIVDSLWLTRRPSVEFLPSPTKECDLIFSNLICVGGPNFNSATDYYFRTGKPYLTLYRDREKAELKVERGSRTGEVFSRGEATDIGIVLKLKDADKHTVVFLTAGLSGNGTRAAVLYLVNNWEELYKKYGDDDFGIGLRCPNRREDPEGYKRVEVLIQLPH